MSIRGIRDCQGPFCSSIIHDTAARHEKPRGAFAFEPQHHCKGACSHQNHFHLFTCFFPFTFFSFRFKQTFERISSGIGVGRWFISVHLEMMSDFQDSSGFRNVMSKDLAKILLELSGTSFTELMLYVSKCGVKNESVSQQLLSNQI